MSLWKDLDQTNGEVGETDLDCRRGEKEKGRGLKTSKRGRRGKGCSRGSWKDWIRENWSWRGSCSRACRMGSSWSKKVERRGRIKTCWGSIGKSKSRIGCCRWNQSSWRECWTREERSPRGSRVGLKGKNRGWRSCPFRRIQKRTRSSSNCKSRKGCRRCKNCWIGKNEFNI